MPLLKAAGTAVSAAALCLCFMLGAAYGDITESRLMPGDAPARGYFGYASGISGDYAVAGSAGDGYNPESPGAAYVFRREGGAWTEEAKLEAPDDDGYDNFGKAIGVSGDYIVVGASGDDDRANSAGAAYIFVRENGAWSLQAKLTASDAAAYDGFGNSAAVSGTCVIVGASGDDGSAANSGAAYIFRRNGAAWTQEAKLTASDAAIYDYFGQSVAVSGNRAVIGIRGCGTCGGMPEPEGAAYVFAYDGAAWTQEAKLRAPDAAVRDLFGFSVGISGDYIVCGAPGDDDGGSNSGSVYVFRREGAAWVYEAKLAAGDPEAADALGEAVAISGAYVIAGAWGGDDRGRASGAAYIFRREGAAWTEHAKLLAGNGQDYAQLGKSVSIADGYALAGAPFHDGAAGADTGAAYIYAFLQQEDTEPPPVPQNVTAAEISAVPCCQVAVSWDASSDNTGVKEYRIFRNGGAAATVTGTAWTDTAALPLTEYSYTVAACDFAGNCSAESGPASVTTSAGSNTAPTLAFAEPDGRDDTAQGFFVIEWTDEDPDDDAQISLYYDTDDNGADGVLIVSGLSEDAEGTGDEYVWNTSEIPSGSYYVYAVISDGVNSVTARSSGPVIVTGYIPELRIIRFSADPDTVAAGETSVLTWETVNADTVSIEPGIGAVNADGSLTVQPSVTTAYTLTAVMQGTVKTAAAEIKVLPEVTVSADPVSVQPGESSVLTWNAKYADGCVIQPGTRTVGTQGTLTVTPSETTEYSLTASGPGGTATARVTVSVASLPPQITVSADPASVRPGESSVLTWNAKYADGCVIQPGTRTVGTQGTLTVTPDETTEYSVTASGPGGTATARVTVRVSSAVLSVSVTEPADGQNVSGKEITVQGTFVSEGSHAGITVNGVPAHISGSRFFANHVSLPEEGVNIVKAVITDIYGNTAASAVTVVSLPSDARITLEAYPRSGLAPLTVKLDADFFLPNQQTGCSLAWKGPEAPTITKSELRHWELVFDAPGFYTLVYLLTDAAGIQYSEKIMINVMSRESADAFFRSLWSEMRQALINGNIEGALNYFHEGSRAGYREIFDALADRLPEIASAMREPQLIYTIDNIVKYRIKKEETVGGTTYDVTYYIYFIIGYDGLWKIEGF